MADIINLGRARKSRDKALASALASANRARHGRTRGERAADRSAAARLARAQDQARLDPAPEIAPTEG